MKNLRNDTKNFAKWNFSEMNFCEMTHTHKFNLNNLFKLVNLVYLI